MWFRRLEKDSTGVSEAVSSSLGFVGSRALVVIVAFSAFTGSTFRDTQILRDALFAPISAKQAWMVPDRALSDFRFLQERVVDEHGWTAERARTAIVEYLKFLQMLSESPRMELIASTDIDLVWHEHLLDTSNYARDCVNLFGAFLHHRRARTIHEFDLIPIAYERTKNAYASRFGGSPPEIIWGAHTEAASMCGGGNGLNPVVQQMSTTTSSVQSVGANSISETTSTLSTDELVSATHTTLHSSSPPSSTSTSDLANSSGGAVRAGMVVVICAITLTNV